ncbi:MAG: hypothetical protein UR53_C0006G0009, partial [Candidatus Magasanikbacteria bacterium GW2011_GWC2_34_16]
YYYYLLIYYIIYLYLLFKINFFQLPKLGLKLGGGGVGAVFEKPRNNLLENRLKFYGVQKKTFLRLTFSRKNRILYRYN